MHVCASENEVSPVLLLTVEEQRGVRTTAQLLFFEPSGAPLEPTQEFQKSHTCLVGSTYSFKALLVLIAALICTEPVAASRRFLEVSQLR